MDEMEAIFSHLDSSEPCWEVKWADQVDLKDRLTGGLSERGLKLRLYHRFIQRVINSAISAGVVHLNLEA